MVIQELAGLLGALQYEGSRLFIWQDSEQYRGPLALHLIQSLWDRKKKQMSGSFQTVYLSSIDSRGSHAGRLAVVDFLGSYVGKI